MSTAPKPRARPAPAPSSFNVRQVTNAQASWRAQAGKEGAFELQLILDHGAAEHRNAACCCSPISSSAE